MATPPGTRLMTADEFDALPEPDDGSKLELDEGVVVVARPAPESEEAMVTFEHGDIQTAIASALRSFVREHRLGRVVVESHFRFRPVGHEEDVVRGPDVAFVSRERLPDPARMKRGSSPVVPDLAVEVVSPSDRAADMERKVHQYLDAGAARVWVVYPSDQTLTVFQAGGDAHRYGVGDTLSSEEAGFATAGFSVVLADVFESVV